MYLIHCWNCPNVFIAILIKPSYTIISPCNRVLKLYHHAIRCTANTWCTVHQYSTCHYTTAWEMTYYDDESPSRPSQASCRRPAPACHGRVSTAGAAPCGTAAGTLTRSRASVRLATTAPCARWMNEMVYWQPLVLYYKVGLTSTKYDSKTNKYNQLQHG